MALLHCARRCVLAALLVTAALAQSSGANEATGAHCSSVRLYPDHALNATIFQTVRNVSTVDTCHTLCAAAPRCSAFTWFAYKYATSCYLATDLAPNYLKPADLYSGTSGVCAEVAAPPESSCARAEMYSDTDFVSDRALAMVWRHVLDDCRAECARQPRCAAFTWAALSGTCTLKSAAALQNAVYAPGTTAGRCAEVAAPTWAACVPPAVEGGEVTCRAEGAGARCAVTCAAGRAPHNAQLACVNGLWNATAACSQGPHCGGARLFEHVDLWGERLAWFAEVKSADTCRERCAADARCAAFTASAFVNFGCVLYGPAAHMTTGTHTTAALCNDEPAPVTWTPCEAPTLAHGRVCAAAGAHVPSGETCSVTCDAGYEPSYATVQCLEGRWTADAAQITCATRK